jgi:phosphatidate cytidylyltransferase
MTPSAALHDRVFLIYLGLAAAALALAAGGITLAERKLGRDVSHAWGSYRGWLVMIPVIFFSIFAGREWVIIFFTLLSALAFKEYARATGLYRDWWMTGVVYVLIVVIGALCLMEDPRLHVPGWYGLFAVAPAYAFAAILAVPIIRNRAEGQLQYVALAAVGFIYIGWMFGHLAFLANAKEAYGYLLYLIFAVELNDVAAFACGRLFGRHQMRSNISPNKTWEGALGALVVSMILPWLLWFSFPQFSKLELVLTGLIVGVGGQFGDLSISLMKRDLKIKDMGAAIRGHGGILDRVDSMIYVAPLFFHMVRWFHDLY